MDVPLNIHGDPLTPVVLETNMGGVRTYICGCGALIFHDLWDRHQQTCPDNPAGPDPDVRNGLDDVVYTHTPEEEQ